MNKEYSFGIIPLKQDHGHWQVFLVQHREGHWTLPKGHQEAGETPLATAERELFEETALEIEKLLFKEPLVEEYMFQKKGKEINKRVTYFVAEVTGGILLQEEEIQDGDWFDLEDAMSQATYFQTQELLKKVYVSIKALH